MDKKRPQSEASGIYQEFIQKLDELRRKKNLEALALGSEIFALTALAGGLIAVLVEAAFHFDPLGRTLLVGVYGLSLIGVFIRFILYPLLCFLGILRSKTDDELAQEVGQHSPSIKDRLVNLLQIYRESASDGHGRIQYSMDLIRASFLDLYQEAKDLRFTGVVNFQKPKRFAKILSFSAGFSLLVFLFSPAVIHDASYRLIHFRESFERPLPFSFTIRPGNTEVVKGENISIVVIVEGELLNQLEFFTRQAGQVDYEKIFLRRDSAVTFRHEILAIKNSMDYFVQAREIESEKYTISVIDRPVVKNLKVRLKYPAYAGLSPKDLEDNVGDVTALAGTTVNLEITTNKPLSRGTIIFSDRTEVPLSLDGINAKANFLLHKDKSYHLLSSDAKGLTNTDPIEYHLTVVPDEFPTVIILQPGKNIDLTEDMKLNMLFKLRDDFGVTKLRLGYRLVHSHYEQPAADFTFFDISLPEQRSNDMEVSYLWDLNALHLATEDVVSYFAEVYDNDNIKGPKVGKSETFTLRIPSLNEIFADIDKTQEQSIEKLGETLDEAKELKKEFDDINQELKKNQGQLDWQKQKKAEELVKKYENLEKKLDEVSQNLDQTIQKMEKNSLISPETLEKYLELQKLFDQLNSPEFQQAMKKLQEVLRNITPEQLRQAMQNFTFSEEMFRQSIERTLNILKRIQLEQKMDEMVKRTNELLQKQEELKKETSNTNPNDKQKLGELSKKQSDLQKDLENLQRELAELQKKMEEFPDEMPLAELQKAMEELAKQNISQMMLQSAQQLQAGQMGEAQQNQQRTMQSLLEILKQLEQAQQAMLQKQLKQIVNELRKTLQDLLELSRREENLKNESQSLEANSQRFRENAHEQMSVLNELMVLIDNIIRLSQKTFAVTPEIGRALGQALNQMNQAMANLELRSGIAASQQQVAAMSSLNEAALQVQGSLQAMMQGGGSGELQSLLQRLQQLIGRQQGINMMTLDLGQLQQLTMEQQAEMARLAAQQEAVRKSLEQLNEEAKQSSEKDKFLGDLGKITEEMKEVVKDLEQQNVNPRTLQNQERILSRLLDAQRSIRERDFEKRRKAEPGREITRRSPAEIDLTMQEGKNHLQQDLLKALEEGYAKDYEELIRKYFEALQKRELERR